jgi:glycosyltransferase 2 family protein
MPTETSGRPWLARTRRLATSLWVRIGMTLALLAIVASRLDWAQMGRRVREGRPADFVIATALVLFALVVGAYRWHLLLKRARVYVNASRLTRIYAVSTFSNTFLPTSVGGDVARALLLARRGPVLTRVVTTIVIDRLGGLLGLIGLAWIAFALAPGVVPHSSRVLLAWATAGLLGVSIALLLGTLHQGVRMRRLVPARFVATARECRSLLRDCAQDPSLLIAWLLTSIIFQTLIALQLVMLAEAIQVHLPFATAAVALALVTILTMLPISIGGFGVREGSYVVLLGSISIAASDATLISVLTVATLFLVSLPGAYLIIRGRIGSVHTVAPE